MSDVFRKSFEVRWDDVDLNGHLRSTRYPVAVMTHFATAGIRAKVKV
jgi:acyl-CoA thioesterase FadM